MTNKPTFGATPSVVDEKLAEARKTRPEVGAIWKNSTKNNSEFMTIKLNMPKSKLLAIVENSQTDENGNVSVALVAFPNRHQEGNSKRPAFRVFEELNKN
jgi:uncharacterized protein (DUF736 family)